MTISQLSFAAYSMIGLLLLIVLSRKWQQRWKVLTVFCIAGGVALAVSILVRPSDVIPRGNEQAFWYRTPWWELILFFVMWLGMASKYLWDLINLRRSKSSDQTIGKPRVPLEFDFWDFVQPLLVSAIVFASILGVVKNLNPASLLLSFQNGFFWQSVLKQKLPENDRSAR